MTIFADIFITLIVLAILITEIEALAFLVPYVGIAWGVIVGVLIIKYGVYIFNTYRVIGAPEIDEATGRKVRPSPVVLIKGLAVYPVLDIVRQLLLIGLVSSIYNGVIADRPVFGVFIDSMLYLVIIVAAYVIDFITSESDTWIPQLILMGVYCVILFIFTRSAAFDGLGYFFHYLSST